MEVGARRGIVEASKESANLRSPARGGIAATLGEETEFGNAGCAAVTDDLNYAGHGVGAVEGAFCAVDDFHFVDVVEGEIGIVEVATRLVDGSAINQNFCEAGIAAVQEESGEAAE